MYACKLNQKKEYSNVREQNVIWFGLYLLIQGCFLVPSKVIPIWQDYFNVFVCLHGCILNLRLGDLWISKLKS